MSDEGSVITHKDPDIVDPANVPVVFVDYVITAGHHEGVMNVALGTIDHSRKAPEEELAKVVVAARMRFSREFALRLYIMLGDFLGFPRPVLDTGPQPPPPVPQKNMLN